MTLIKSIISMFSKQKALNDKKVDRHKTNMVTVMIDMSFNHVTRNMDGVVLAGEFEGKKLSELSLDQINKMIDVCGDEETVSLLMAYKDRNFSSVRRSSERKNATVLPGFMSIHEAREMLGVDEGCEIDDVNREFDLRMRDIRSAENYSDLNEDLLGKAKDILLAEIENR